MSADSVGLVEPKTHHFDQALKLDCGRTLPQYDLIYETYGELNDSRSNAILICHALSGDHHAAGYHSEDDKKPGWWDSCIGPGKPIDTDVFFVVSLNNLGGCRGSTGPTTIDPGIRDRNCINVGADLDEPLNCANGRSTTFIQRVYYMFSVLVVHRCYPNSY